MVNARDNELHMALSAVMDGRADAADWARVNHAWAQDPALRERWRLWHDVSDGLHAPDLPPLRQDPETLLAALRERADTREAPPPRRREWLAPLAVAASFIAVAVGIGALQPAAAPPLAPVIAAAPAATPRAPGLSGLSFAQTAAGRTLAGDAPPEVIDWGLALPEPAASHPPP